MSTPWPPTGDLDDIVDGFWMWGLGVDGLYDHECEDADMDIEEDGCGIVWCPLFRHQIGITHRNTGVCRHCVAEGFQEAPSDA